MLPHRIELLKIYWFWLHNSSEVRGVVPPPLTYAKTANNKGGGTPPPSYAKQQISIYGQNYGGGGYPPPYGQNYGRLRSHTDFWRSFNRSKIGLIFTPVFCNASRNTWGQQPEWLAWWKSSFGRMKRVWGSELWGWLPMNLGWGSHPHRSTSLSKTPRCLPRSTSLSKTPRCFWNL